MKKCSELSEPQEGVERGQAFSKGGDIHPACFSVQAYFTPDSKKKKKKYLAPIQPYPLPFMSLLLGQL